MTPAELKRELQEGIIRPAYLLAGTEALHRDDCWRRIRDAIRTSTAESEPEESGGEEFMEMNEIRLRGGESQPGEVRDATRTLPIFSKHRFITLREPEAGRSKSMTEALAQSIESLRQQDGSPAIILAVIASKSPDRRANWVKAFQDPAVLVLCEAPTRKHELIAAIREEAQSQGVQVEPDALEALAEANGPQLMQIRQEIQQAALLTGEGNPVRRDHVLGITSRSAQRTAWELAESIGMGRSDEAMQTLSTLLRDGNAPQMILGALAHHFRKLLRTQHGATPRSHPQAMRSLESQARRYPETRMQQCFEAIHRADEEMKGLGQTGNRPQITLEWLVLGLSA